MYWEESDYQTYPTTADYARGTCIIYSSPKRPKNMTPVYGYKFVQTDRVRKSKKIKARART